MQYSPADLEQFATVFTETNSMVEAARSVAAITAKTEAGLRIAGQRLMRQAKAAVDAKFAEGTMGVGELINRVSAIARADMEDFIDPATERLSWARARERKVTRLVREYTERVVSVRATGSGDEAAVETVIERKIKLHDPQVAHSMLGKYHGILTDYLAIRGLPADPSQLRDVVAGELARLKGGQQPRLGTGDVVEAELAEPPSDLMKAPKLEPES